MTASHRPFRTSFLLPAALVALLAGCGATETPKPTVKPRQILNKTTQRVLTVEDEVKKGAVVLDRAPNDNVYVYATAQPIMDMINKQHIVGYEITNNAYPKDTEDFINVILKANHQELPELPYYLEYGYDAGKHQLVILEYPEKKKQREKERDAK
jgi:hypothetical protein